jgi:hypothetical protein
MNDSDKETPQDPTNKLADAEYESIIDLVEEIEEESPAELLPELERQLLGIHEAPDGLDPGSPSATALPDLSKLDFEEDEDQPTQAGPSGEPALGVTGAPGVTESMDWLFDPAAGISSENREELPAESDAALVETIGDEQPVPEPPPGVETAGRSPSQAAPGDVDDEIELIDIEEADNELDWLDDLNLDALPSSIKTPADTTVSESLFTPSDGDLFSETTAADVFAANVAFAGISAESAPLAPGPPEAAIPALAPPAPPPSAAEPSPPSSVPPPPEDGPKLSNEQIEAAVERLIERRLGGSLESIVRRAVEAAVTKEIKRLQQLLLEYDPDNPTS